MYMRPRLSRKKTADRIILSREQAKEVEDYKHILSTGEDFDSDMATSTELVSEVNNSQLSCSERNALLAQLSALSSTIQEEYTSNVESELTNIEYSMQERIDEIADATCEHEHSVFVLEQTVWKTNTIDKEQLISTANDICKTYHSLLDQSKADLQELKKQSNEQRNRINERYMKKRR